MLAKTLMIATALGATVASAAHAAADPVGDFLGTYGGTPAAGLDIIDTSAVFDGTSFTLTARMNGPVSTAPGSLFVWGIDRGAGVARLNLISDPDLDPGVKWDAVAVMFPNGNLRVVTFPGPSISFDPTGVSISGDTLTTSIALSALPSQGFSPDEYRFQLWTRLRVNPLADGNNTEIADFGRRISASVPEPDSWAMMIVGFAGAGMLMRRRRVTAFA